MPSDELPPLPPHLDPRGKRAARKAAQAQTGPAATTGSRSSRHHGRNRQGGTAVKQISLYATKGIATALSLALLIGTGIYWWQYREFRSGLDTVNISDAQGSKIGKTDIDGKDQNILLVGNDDRSGMTNKEVRDLHVGRDGGSLNTDVMMILHVPADGKKATIISLPRDTYVAIPGYGQHKLNSAYADAYNATGGSKKQKQAAGANLLIQTISNLTGLTIDHYVSINFLGFARISEAIGPITVNMCQAVDDSYTSLKLPKGKSQIYGASALGFVRQRHGLPLGDIDRTHRAQYFLTAAFRSIASIGGITKLNSIFNAVKKSIIIDGGLDPLKLGAQMQALTANNIVAKTIPYTTLSLQTPSDGSAVGVDLAAVKTFVNKLVGTEDSALTNAKTVDPSTVTVSVLNAGTGENGVATTNGKLLQQLGFQLGPVDDAPAAVNATTIEYATGMESAAKTLSQHVPGAVLVKANVKVLTLELGPDGVRVKAPSGSSSSASASSSTSSSTAKPTKPIDSKCIN